jgi:Flp pilus assembly protein TadG
MWQSLKHMVKSRYTQFRNSEKGVAAIEFAMVAPPFIYVLGVIIETGMMLFTEYALQSAVQDSARLVRTGQAQGGQLNAAAFKDKICQTASTLIDCAGKVYVYVRSDTNFATLKANLPAFETIGPTFVTGTNPPSCYNPGQPSQPAAVIATYDWYFNMMGMSAMGNVNSNAARRLVGFAIFRNEPFPANGTPTC